MSMIYKPSFLKEILMVSLTLLKRILDEQEEDMKYVRIKPRELFKDIEDSMDLKEITVLSGVRRSGKTYILYHLARKFDGVYLNFEDERLIGFEYEDFDKLYNLVGSRPLLLDEVQNVRGWEKFVRRIHNKVKVVVSGSNSQLLGSEFATTLTGRTITFNIYPLNYSEFLNFKELNPSIHSFERYLELGGFPRIVETERKEFIREYFDMIIYRDILPRFNIKYSEALKDLAVYLLSHIGKPYSYRNLSRVIGIKHEMTVKEYIRHLESSFLVYELQKFDPSYRSRERSPKKIYTVDPMFARIGFSDHSVNSRLLENIVYLHLIRKFGRKNVYYYLGDREIDFLIAENLKPKMAINVSYSIENEDTLEREIKGLLSINPKLKKYLITLYPLDFDLPKSITHVPAVELLSGKVSL